MAAAHATANVFGMAAELPKLAQTVRQDEQVLRATRGAVAADSKLIAVTGTRLIIVSSAVHRATMPAPQPLQAPPPPAPAPPPAQPDVLGQITKLGELHAAGVLTDEEFRTKKAQLLDRL